MPNALTGLVQPAMTDRTAIGGGGLSGFGGETVSPSMPNQPNPLNLGLVGSGIVNDVNSQLDPVWQAAGVMGPPAAPQPDPAWRAAGVMNPPVAPGFDTPPAGGGGVGMQTPASAIPNTFAYTGVDNSGAFMPGNMMINHDTLGTRWPVTFEDVAHDPFNIAAKTSGLYG